MKKIVLVSLLFIGGVVTAANMHFEKNAKCSSCHPKIYEEYMGSQHGNATIFKDKLHGAVYNKHPQKNKLQKYRCAKCHTPTADNLSELLTPHNGVTPDAKNETQNEAVACAYCHRIEEVKSGKAMSKNIISKEPLSYFSNKEKPGTSPFHKITTKKAIFKDAKLCMGCHTHKANKKGFNVCATGAKDMNAEKNCISCHMPQVEGASSIMSKGTKHRFHGFPGIHGDLKLLSKYVTLDLSKEKSQFKVSVKHDVTHASSLHPLRMSKLLVSVERDGNVTQMKTEKLFQVIGAEVNGTAKPTPPWLATKIIKDSRIDANSKKEYAYAFTLKKGDKVKVKFGHLLMKKKAAKKFGLEANEEANKFRVLSEKTFVIE